MDPFWWTLMLILTAPIWVSVGLMLGAFFVVLPGIALFMWMVERGR